MNPEPATARIENSPSILRKPLSKQDLDHVLEHASKDLQALRGAQIFVTGGTGFFGKWLVSTFVHADREFALQAKLTVLTRDPQRFRCECPQLAGENSIILHAGDVRDFEFPRGAFTHVIHGASGPGHGPLGAFDTITQGTRRVLEFVALSGVRRFLFLSSGAVYGQQPPEIRYLPETYSGAPDPLQVAAGYGEAKRAAEHMSRALAAAHGFDAIIARCFAFCGPYLPMDSHFAVGNFLRDVLAERSILVQGDGTPYRSYLFAADLAVWLWALLVRGATGRAYNVGSDEDVTIAELATAVVEASAYKCEIRIAQPSRAGAIPQRYVPSIDRARSELGLEARIRLMEGLRRTLDWLRQP